MAFSNFDLGWHIRLVGVGEASFISLAAPFIDDNAPPPQVLVWFFILFSIDKLILYYVLFYVDTSGKLFLIII